MQHLYATGTDGGDRSRCLCCFDRDPVLQVAKRFKLIMTGVTPVKLDRGDMLVTR